MNVIRYNNKCTKSLIKTDNIKLIRHSIKNNQNKQPRTRIICNVNLHKKNNQKNSIISTEKQTINNSNSYIDNGLFVFTTLVFSSIMVLSTCIVMILCARETNMEALSLQEEYNKLYEEVKHLEEKNMDDEMMINAIVGEVVKLKSIGII
jgi:hypothetical protein